MAAVVDIAVVVIVVAVVASIQLLNAKLHDT